MRLESMKFAVYQDMASARAAKGGCSLMEKFAKQGKRRLVSDEFEVDGTVGLRTALAGKRLAKARNRQLSRPSKYIILPIDEDVCDVSEHVKSNASTSAGPGSSASSSPQSQRSERETAETVPDSVLSLDVDSFVDEDRNLMPGIPCSEE